MPRHARANCYGYALDLDWNLTPGTRHGDDSPVSAWSGKAGVKRVTATHRRELMAACEHDGLARSAAKAGVGSVKIAVFIHLYKNSIDFHFYREEPYGQWSHKLGAQGVEQEVREPKSADSSLVDLGVSQNGDPILHEAFVGFLWAPHPFPVAGDEWDD